MDRQFSVSPEQALKKRFSSHRFVVSPVGLFKLLAIILLLVGSIISLTSDICSTSNTWLTIAFPVVMAVSGVVCAVLYASAILGLARRIPTIWAKVDISCCITISLLTTVISILLLANCSNLGTVSIVPGVFGIIGAVLLIITSATLFITWGSVEDDVVELPPARDLDHNKRKSVFI